jgi:hypothetical protein
MVTLSLCDFFVLQMHFLYAFIEPALSIKLRYLTLVVIDVILLRYVLLVLSWNIRCIPTKL